VSLDEAIAGWCRTLAPDPVVLKLAGLAVRCGQNV